MSNSNSSETRVEVEVGGGNMNKKDKFVERFKEKTGGQHPNDFKRNPSALSAILSGDEELERLFREAWVECPVEPVRVG